MKHLTIFIHIISMLVAISAITLTMIAYVRYKEILIKYYSNFLIALSILLLEQTASIYKVVNNLNNNIVNDIFMVCSFISCSYIIFILPTILQRLLSIESKINREKVFKILAFISMILMVLYYLLKYKYIIFLANSILFIVILYTLAISLKYRGRIVEKEIQKIFNKLVILTIAFFPYMYLDTKVKYISILSKYFPYGLQSVAVFLLMWNSISIYYVIVYLKENKLIVNKNEKENADQEKIAIYNKYKITNREREVIELLLKGYSYKNIGEELVISLSTVKTHIRNIYQKTEVKSKIELINIING